MKLFVSILCLVAVLWIANTVHAAPCAGFTYTLVNGQIADANQVMSNFNTVRNCIINGTAASGANNDITSLNALSTPLSVSQGGTGGTSVVTSFNGRNNSITLTGADVTTALGFTPASISSSNTFSAFQHFSLGLQAFTQLGPGYGAQIVADPTNTAAILQFVNTSAAQWCNESSSSTLLTIGCATQVTGNLTVTGTAKVNGVPANPVSAYAVVSCTSGGCSVSGGNNVASVTRTSIGMYQVNFSTAMPDNQYAAVMSPVQCYLIYNNGQSTTQVGVATFSGFGTSADCGFTIIVAGK